MKYLNDDSGYPESYHKSGKRQVKLVDPKMNLGGLLSEASKSPFRKGNLNEDFSPVIYVPKNADYRVVPGALMKKPIDFSKVEEKDDEQGGDLLNIQNDQIDPSDVHRAEPFFEFFTKDTVKSMFSRRWQNREEGYKMLKSEVENLFSSNSEISKSVEDNKRPNSVENSSGTSTNIIAFNKNKHECIKLICNAVERGLNDKIVQVRFKSLDLIKTFLQFDDENNIELKELSNLVGILVDYLSESNIKLSTKSNEILKLALNKKHFDFNEGLFMVISKTSSKNKAFTRFNHSKLSFIIEALEEHASESDANKVKQVKKAPFPTGILLDFIEKMIVVREKILSKETREKVEKAYIFSYQNSSFYEIKDYIDSLDSTSQINLSKHIPEIEIDHLPKENVEEKQREEDTNKKLIELK